MLEALSKALSGDEEWIEGTSSLWIFWSNMGSPLLLEQFKHCSSSTYEHHLSTMINCFLVRLVIKFSRNCSLEWLSSIDCLYYLHIMVMWTFLTYQSLYISCDFVLTWCVLSTLSFARTEMCTLYIVITLTNSVVPWIGKSSA